MFYINKENLVLTKVCDVTEGNSRNNPLDVTCVESLTEAGTLKRNINI